MLKNKTTIYHETLSSVIDDVRDNFLSVNNIEVPSFESYDWDAVGYGETSRNSFQIEKLNNRKTKKYFHIIIFRLDSGRYELTCYVL
jgi:hypothetical protein